LKSECQFVWYRIRFVVNMARVTYFLGAGASADCLPVVNQMKDDLDRIKKEVKNRFPHKKGFYVKINDALNRLQVACREHSSIDTYAKKLFFVNTNSFATLKIDLTYYLTLVQFLNDPDKRYDNFWASILKTICLHQLKYYHGIMTFN
jgi:hypothetical protein